MSEKVIRYFIPRHLDAPMCIILWTVDELFALFLPIALVYSVTNHLWPGLIMGVFALYTLKKRKSNKNQAIYQ